MYELSNVILLAILTAVGGLGLQIIFTVGLWFTLRWFKVNRLMALYTTVTLECIFAVLTLVYILLGAV